MSVFVYGSGGRSKKSTSYTGPLSTATWAQIDSVEDPSSIWDIGDEKDVTLTTGEVLTFQIWGFNHDDRPTGVKAKITFGMKNLMAATRQMNASNTNAGSFVGSKLYGELQSEIYPTLPIDLRMVIKSVNKMTSSGSASSVIRTDAVNIFLPSFIECCGTRSNQSATTYPGEGTKYAIFPQGPEANASRIKKLSNGAGAAAEWWGRSPRDNTDRFSFCQADGMMWTYLATSLYGVCFCFCV